MDFGQYTIITNARHVLKKEPTWYWEFKPVTAKEELAISKFIRGGEVTTNAQGITRNIKTTEEIAIEELVLTFAGTNIPEGGQDGGDPILTPTSSPDKVRSVIESLPRELYMELWYAMGKHVPGWGPDVEPDDDPKN